MGNNLSDMPQQGTMSNVPLGDNSEVSSIVEQARGRSDGFLYGEDKAIGDHPNWAAQESEQLYRYATVNNEPGTAEELGHTWSGHSTNLHQAADDLYNAISELGSAWVGQGAGAAQGSLVSIANSSAQAAEAANTMSSRLAQQAAAAAELKKMPQPQDFDPGAETAAMLAGGPAAMTKDMKEQFDAARETKAQQVAYLEAYTAAMSEVDNTTPSFGPESLGLPGNTAGTNLNVGGVGGTSGYGMPGSGSVGGTFAGVGNTPPISGHADNTVHAAGFSGAPQHGGAAAPPPGSTGPAPPGQGMAAASAAGAAQATPSAPASGGPSVGQSLGAAVAGGALGYAGAKALGKGSRSGSTKQQSSETGASANQANSAASVQPQNQGMVSPGGTIGAQQQAAATTGAPMGGGMGGAGAANQEEEKEHTHASFLIEPDPDDAFGATQATPPPVLGAWGPDDDEER